MFCVICNNWLYSLLSGKFTSTSMTPTLACLRTLALSVNYSHLHFLSCDGQTPVTGIIELHIAP